MNTENRKPRSKQFTKEELLSAIEKFNNDKIKMAEFLEIGSWALREQLKKHGINTDKRIDECKSRTIIKPPKEALEQLYNINMTLVDIGKIYKVSNVTVKKWFNFYDIQLDSHSDTIKNRVCAKNKNKEPFENYADYISKIL